MANFDQLKQSVAALIRTNGAEEITGQIMQDVLLTIINSISGGYMFGGVAQHSGNVGNPDYNVFYLAGSGAYTGYGDAINIPDGCYGVFRYNGSWTQDVVDIGVHLTGTISAGETNGVTGDVINTALQQLFNNIMNILDTLTFTYNTPSGQQATKAMLDVIVTPTGGASHVLTTLTLVSATAAAAGLMSAEDKRKVDRMLTDFRSLSFSDTTAVADQATKIVQTLSATLGENPEAITTMTFLAATASKAGLLSAADKANLDALWSSGYQFVGIATPSTTPISTTSKIFYIATEAGIYFNAVTVTQGINIIYKSGDAWSVAQVVGIDNEPTAGSDRLVKSGGVFGELALGAVYDVSAKNPTAGPNSDGKWESLSALLSDANLNTLIPTSVRKGGMSIKYVQSSDNKYVQARCMAQNFTTDVTQWQCIDDKPTDGSENIVLSKGISYENNVIKNNVTIIDSLNYVLSIEPSIINGLIVYDGSILGNASMKLYTIPVKTGDHFRVETDRSGYYGFCSQYPKSGLSAVGTGQNNADVLSRNDFVAPIDGYFCLSQDTAANFTNFYYINNGIGSLSREHEKEIESVITNSAYYNLFGQVFPDRILGSWADIELNRNYSIYFTSVKEGEKIHLNVSSTINIGYTEGIPLLYESVTGNITNVSKDTANSTEYVSPIDGFMCVSIRKANASVTFMKIPNGIYQIESILDNALEEDNKDLDAQTVAGIVAWSTGEFLANPKFTTYYVPAIMGQAFSVSASGNPTDNRICFCREIPTLNVAIEDFQKFGNYSDLSNYKAVAPIDGYFAVSLREASNVVVTKIANGLAARVKSLEGNSQSVDVNLPLFVYAIYNSGNYAKNIIQSLKPEGLFNAICDFKIDGGNECPVYPYPGSWNSFTRTIKVTDGNAVVSQKSFTTVIGKSNMIPNNLIKILCIGDSWTTANLNSLKNEEVGAWNYASAIVDHYKDLQVDLDDNTGNLIALGSIGKKTRQSEFGNYDITACTEGRGSWSSQNYLRHAVAIHPEGVGTLSGKIAWDLLGCGRKQPIGQNYDESAEYTPYVSDAAHQIEYLTTTQGYYHWDYSTELMNFLGISGTYTGTAEQKTAIDSAIESMMDSPVNRFYDKNVAVSSNGEYAFSLQTYLNRYKTLEENGVTRLVVGSTAGTKISSNKDLNNIDVCTPTHVIIELGVNDYLQLSVTQKANDIKKIAQLIYNYDNNIKVGIAEVHIPHVFNPGVWYDKAAYIQISNEKLNKYFLDEKSMYFVNKSLSDGEVWKKTGICYVPTYSVIGSTARGARICKNINGNDIILDGTDDLHPAIDVHKEIGFQILGWLLYSIS